MSVPENVAAEILARCGRCCCLCRRFRPTLLQVHHIVEEAKGGTDDPDNLIAVCLTCHSDVHTKRPFARRFTAEEQRQHRDKVFRLVADGKLTPRDDDTTEAPLVRIDPSPLDVSLSPESVDVLLSTAESPRGYIILSQHMGGFVVSPESRYYEQPSSPREIAKIKSAVEQLAENDLLDEVNEGVFNVTHKGFLLADELLALQERTQSEPKDGD